jgi:hypothetical protein
MSDNTTVRVTDVQPMGKYTLQLKWLNGRRLPDVQSTAAHTTGI